MYSLIVMTAMASSPETPEFHGFFRRLFSLGDAGCTGGRTSGAASSCTGCCGGYSNSRMRAFQRDDRAYGSCNGRTSAGASSSCTGSRYASGCCGGSYYQMAPVPADPFGMPPLPSGEFAVPQPAAPPPSSSLYLPGVVYTYPTYSYSNPGSGCFGTAPFTVPAPPQSAPAQQREAIPPTDVPVNRGPIALAGGDATRATVVVRLPADAKLFAEGRPLTLTGDSREFVTPPLPDGSFSYRFRVEYTRNGATISESKSLSVRRGGNFPVEFVDLMAAKQPPESKPSPAAPRTLPDAVTNPTRLAAETAAPTGKPQPARIVVKLPPGGVLYVDGQRNDRTDLVRQFDTVPLPAGKDYAYQMRVERTRDGLPESSTMKVTFRAAEIAYADFTAWPSVPTPPAGLRAGK